LFRAGYEALLLVAQQASLTVFACFLAGVTVPALPTASAAPLFSVAPSGAVSSFGARFLDERHARLALHDHELGHGYDGDETAVVVKNWILPALTCDARLMVERQA
jgi:hypothetical protein